MKKLLAGFVLLSVISGCKKEGALTSGNLNDVPARFYFIIANNQGQSLLSSLSDAVSISYLVNGSLTKPESYPPFKTFLGASTAYVFYDGYMAPKSEAGIKTFYLTFQGKTDTLGLDIREVPATPDNGGNSTPIVTFNGRPMQSAPGGTDTPDYFVLKRR